MAPEHRKKREQAAKKKSILRAARKLFFDKGFRSVTVDNIAARADISKGAVYLYFNSKEEIYTQLLFTEIEKFHKKIENILQNGTSATEVMKNFSRIYLDFFLSDRELFRILMNFMLHPEDASLTPEFSNHIIKSTNKTVKMIENIILFGIEQGEFPASVNVVQCRNALWGLLNGVMSLHLFTGEEGKREEKIRSTVSEGLNIFLKGLAGG